MPFGYFILTIFLYSYMNTYSNSIHVDPIQVHFQHI